MPLLIHTHSTRHYSPLTRLRCSCQTAIRRAAPSSDVTAPLITHLAPPQLRTRRKIVSISLKYWYCGMPEVRSRLSIVSFIEILVTTQACVGRNTCLHACGMVISIFHLILFSVVCANLDGFKRFQAILSDFERFGAISNDCERLRRVVRSEGVGS